MKTMMNVSFTKWIASALCGAALGLVASSANAVPAFARQTGQNCVACHVSFPELTPYGRWCSRTA